jgi:hypothetical protein
MISFHQFINLKEALSLNDPLAQSTLKIKEKSSQNITFESTLDNDNYKITIYNTPETIYIEDKKTSPVNIIAIGQLNTMGIYLEVNDSYHLTNKMGMQANIIYNMLLNAIKQAHDHFGENNVHGYDFSGVEPEQNIMYDRLMKRFAPNLITWTYSKFLKPEAVQKLKDQNPNLIDQINEKIHQETSERLKYIKDFKKIKNRIRSLRRITP